VKRLPIKVRLALTFAAVMALVLAATGVFVFVRLRDDLDATIDDGLRSRADAVAAIVMRSGPRFGDADEDRLADHDSFVQVLDGHGRVVGATSNAGARPVLSRDALAHAADESIVVPRRRIARIEDDDEVRLRATPVDAGGRRLVVVVGSSLEDRDEALANLIELLLIGGTGALLLASLAGYGVALLALRPVDAMRREAAAVSGAEPGRRLPVPARRGDEVSRLGETLNAMLARLDAALARERRFVADASHELRTPLANLTSELELAARPGRSRDELQAAVRSAAAETDRLVQLAEDLLVLARADEGRLPVRREDTVAGAVLAAVGGRFAPRAAEAGRNLEVEGGAPIRLLADRARLEQALGDMLDNGLRFSRHTVRLSARERDGEVELHVVDDGPGFPPAFIDRAFDRFSRGDEGSGRGGTGLGLAVVAAIAAGHGGRAGAANRAEGGADVWLALPRSR